MTGSPDDCEAFVEVTDGGNPNLQPETSTQWNVGFVLEPITGLSFGMDYWKIEQENVIGNLTWRNALLNYDQYAGRFVRGPVDPAYPNLPGPIIGFDDTLMNVGTTKTSGIDVTFNWTAPRMDWGLVSIALQCTYVLQWEAQVGGAAYVSQLGTDAYGRAIPRWRSQFTLNWNLGPWGATLAQTYTAGYSDQSPDPRVRRARSAPSRRGMCRARILASSLGNWWPASAMYLTATRQCPTSATHSNSAMTRKWRVLLVACFTFVSLTPGNETWRLCHDFACVWTASARCDLSGERWHDAAHAPRAPAP